MLPNDTPQSIRCIPLSETLNWILKSMKYTEVLDALLPTWKWDTACIGCSTPVLLYHTAQSPFLFLPIVHPTSYLSMALHILIPGSPKPQAPTCFPNVSKTSQRYLFLTMIILTFLAPLSL